MLLTDSNPTVLAILNCNNCTRYVLNQKVSLYYEEYASKHTNENAKALAELMRALNAYEVKLVRQNGNLENQTEQSNDQ